MDNKILEKLALLKATIENTTIENEQDILKLEYIARSMKIIKHDLRKVQDKM